MAPGVKSEIVKSEILWAGNFVGRCVNRSVGLVR